LNYALLDASGKLVREVRASDSLTGILPQSAPALRQQALSLAGLAAGRYRVLLQVPNPLPAGQPLRFANARQDADLAGWLTLGEFRRD